MSLQPIYDEHHNTESGEVVCLSCNRRTIPNERWRCGECGRNCFYGWGRAACPSCGIARPAQRRGHRWEKILCDCHLSPHERARRASEEAWQAKVAREREEAEEARLEALREKRAKASVDREASASCWDRKGQSCDVVASRPRFGFCLACPKFGRPGPEPRTASPTRDRGYRPPLQDVPMEEVDFG